MAATSRPHDALGQPGHVQRGLRGRRSREAAEQDGLQAIDAGRFAGGCEFGGQAHPGGFRSGRHGWTVYD